MNGNLEELIVGQILELIDAGTIDRSNVRQIAVGISSDGQSINIWQHESWNGYEDFRDDQAIAEISNHEWLEQLDDIGFTKLPLALTSRAPLSHLPNLQIQFENPDYQNIYTQLLSLKIWEITHALKNIAHEQLIGEFDQLVGLMGVRTSTADSDLIAFYHPQGANILPTNERRLPGYSSIYGYMSLLDDGVIHFYPKGENEEETDTVLNHFKFSEMDFFTIKDDEVVFQLAVSGQKIELGAGHTRAEYGGLDSQSVRSLLTNHFKEKAHHLLIDTSEKPVLKEGFIALDKELEIALSTRTVSLPVMEKLDIIPKFIDGWSSRIVKCLKLKNTFDNPVRINESFFLNDNQLWIKNSEQVARLQIKDNQTYPVDTSTIAFNAMTADENFIYLLTDNHLKSLTHTPDSGLEFYSETELSIRYAKQLSVSEGIMVICNDQELQILDVRNPAQVTTLACISLTTQFPAYTRCHTILLNSNLLYLLFEKKCCCVVDIKNLINPEVVSVIPWNCSVAGMAVSGNALILYGINGLAAIDMTQPSQPQFFHAIEFRVDSIFPISTTCFLAGGEGWCKFNYDPQAKTFHTEIFPIFEQAEITQKIYGVNAVLPHEKGYLICQDDESHYIEYEDMAEFGPLANEFESAKPQLMHWFEQALEDLSNRINCPVGNIAVQTYGHDFHVAFDEQRSLPGASNYHAEHNFFHTEIVRGSWAEILKLTVSQPQNTLDYWRSLYLEKQINHTFADILLALPDKPLFKKLASGRCYLRLNDNIIGLIDNGGHWQPWRRKISGRVEVSLSKKLEDFNNWEVYALKCDQDKQLKEELYALARGGNKNALQVVRRRFRQDEDDSISTILHVVKDNYDFFWLDFIEKYSHREDVKAICTDIYHELLNDKGSIDEMDAPPIRWLTGLVSVSVLIGAQDNTELDFLVEKLLFAPDVNYEHYDLAIQFLKAKKNVGPFANIIQQAINNMDVRDNRLPQLAEQLFRAGIYEAPEGLLIQSAPQKRGEQYDSIKCGIAFLDQTSEYDECRIERLFTGQQLLNNFRQRAPVNQSLWPKMLSLEPFPESWTYLLKSILLRMDLSHELDAFIDALVARLAFEPDRHLFVSLFRMLAENADITIDDMSRITRMAACAGDSQLSNEDKILLGELKQTAMANIAWKANAEGDLALANDYVTQLLAEGSRKPTIFFLEARLAWKNTGDPAAALDKALPRLESMHGGTGKARVLNLLGCACDELGRYQESAGYFHRAAEMDPETSFYFDNLAEIYEKMSEIPKALEWAREARRRSSTAPVVARIIDQYGNNQG